MLAAIRDYIHELRIRLAGRLMVWHHERMRATQKTFLRLINARSARTIERMERDKGLV